MLYFNYPNCLNWRKSWCFNMKIFLASSADILKQVTKGDYEKSFEWSWSSGDPSICLWGVSSGCQKPDVVLLCPSTGTLYEWDLYNFCFKCSQILLRKEGGSSLASNSQDPSLLSSWIHPKGLCKLKLKVAICSFPLRFRLSFITGNWSQGSSCSVDENVSSSGCQHANENQRG